MLNDFQVPGFDLQVDASIKIESESLAGQTSSTDRAHNGIKPKSIKVNLLIRFADADELAALVRVIEAVDGDGAPSVYDIVDPMANAMNIRQVQFNDTSSFRQLPGVDAWRITFNLVEKLSIPEKQESRQEAAAPETQSADGQAVAAVSGEDDAQELTGFESILKYADDALAPEDGDGEAA